jgi:hypothetical protein
MPDLFLQRTFDTPVTVSDIVNGAPESIGCFERHRVNWYGSLLSSDGYRMTCRFNAVDAESVRIALRQMDADIAHLWPGTVHAAAGVSEAEQATANVLVERSFGEPVSLEVLETAEDGSAADRVAQGITHLCTCRSMDGRRVISLYRAADPKSVHLLQRGMPLPLDSVWPCTFIRPGWPDSK